MARTVHKTQGKARAKREAPGAREQIKLAARRLFAIRGIDGVSVREIVEAAEQKNHGSLAYYFGTKEALVRELVADGAKLRPGTIALKGIAFDGGKGIKEVAVSADGGKSWTQAKLGKDLGKYSFREWKLPVKLAAGSHELQVRATNNAGDTQPGEQRWNPPGYMRNVVETIRVSAA